VTILERFSTPARLPEPTVADADAWSSRVAALFAKYADLPQFYDPTAEETPEPPAIAEIVWSAFPARLRRETTSERERLSRADRARKQQDEYCEWSVERDANDNITRVTFTTEVREYFEHLAEQDPDRLVALYAELVDSDEVELDDLLAADGTYEPDNKWNHSTEGRLAHLRQDNNNLFAAIDLAARATVLRERDDEPVIDRQALVVCAGLGNEFRNSDPQIAWMVNDAAIAGAKLTLHDPIGLYIEGLLTAGMATPDDEDPAAFWTVERGDTEHTLRARYEVPEDRGYTVTDITSAGVPIRFGAQLADRVQVRIAAIGKPGTHQPVRQPCES
jgi:hypothetical protein